MARRISGGSDNKLAGRCAVIDTALAWLLENLPFGPRCLTGVGRGILCSMKEYE